MRLIQKRDVIRDVRGRWMNQYKHYGDDYRVAWGPRKTAGEIRAALGALDLEACSSADVDAVLGVDRWADNRCDECDADHEVIVRLGEEPGYDARWQDLCADCLAKAAAAIRTPSTGEEQ